MIALSIVNIILFCVWLFVIRSEADQHPQEVYDRLSLHITLLSLFIVIFTVLLTILGFVGYTSIRRGAELVASEIAGKKAEEVASKRMESIIDNAASRQTAKKLQESNITDESSDISKDENDQNI